MRVSRSDANSTARDHEERIRALERAHTPGIYIDDRLLAADATTVVFDSFPDDLVILELTWYAWLVGGASDATLFAAFNDDYPVTGSDYFWRWAGSIAVSTDDSGSDKWGGLGFIGDGGGGLGSSWGRVRFPDYESAEINSAKWIGEAAWEPSGGGAPDVWDVAGYRDVGGPITKVTLFAAFADGDLAAGSRFTLTGIVR